MSKEENPVRNNHKENISIYGMLKNISRNNTFIPFPDEHQGREIAAWFLFQSNYHIVAHAKSDTPRMLDSSGTYWNAIDIVKMLFNIILLWLF